VAWLTEWRNRRAESDHGDIAGQPLAAFQNGVLEN
jgi:hypothetical protein